MKEKIEHCRKKNGGFIFRKIKNKIKILNSENWLENIPRVSDCSFQ